MHHVHFNRGAAASQEYTRRFGDKAPEKVGPAAFDWLSRGAAEAITRFHRASHRSRLGSARRRLRVHRRYVLQALKDARDAQGRRADPLPRRAMTRRRRPTKQDHEARASAKLLPRRALPKGCPLAQQDDRPDEEGCGAGGADRLHQLQRWRHLRPQQCRAHLRGESASPHSTCGCGTSWRKTHDKADGRADARRPRSPLPADPRDAGNIPIFSPRPDLEALAVLCRSAPRRPSDALFMTFAFGMHRSLSGCVSKRQGEAPLCADGKDERPDQDDGASARPMRRRSSRCGRWRQTSSPSARNCRRVPLTTGCARRLTGLNVNVQYLHTKYMLVDPLGDDPLVVTGSANFSDGVHRRTTTRTC